MDTITFRSRLFSYSSHFLTLKFISYARSSIFETLRKGIIKGQLKIMDDEGEHLFGTYNPSITPVVLKVLNNGMWGRLFLSHDLGFAEAYMEGDFDISSLKDVLNLWLDNRISLGGLANTISTLFAYHSAMAINFFRQNLKLARASAAISYDVSNEFMRCFLGESMMYSTALWSDEEDGPRGDLTVGPTDGDLETAQERKIQFFLKKARLRAGDRVLEIGCGWGSMAIAAARLGCIVEGITISVEQKVWAEKRIAEAGFSDTITIRLCDYRELPEQFKNSFDALVSCEMVEAVGHKNYGAYFGMIDWALKKDKGTVVISSTTQPEYRYTEFQCEDFSRRYHWPNHQLPTPTTFINTLQKTVEGKLVVHSIDDHGIHYCRTLREWGRRFEKDFKGSVLEEMQSKYVFLQNPKSLETFKRKWRYLFVYAEVGFARAYTSLHYFTFARPENISEICA